MKNMGNNHFYITAHYSIIEFFKCNKMKDINFVKYHLWLIFSCFFKNMTFFIPRLSEGLILLAVIIQKLCRC